MTLLLRPTEQKLQTAMSMYSVRDTMSLPAAPEMKQMILQQMEVAEVLLSTTTKVC